MRRFLPAAFALALVACGNIKPPPPAALSSFKVEALGLYVGTGASRTLLPVITVCEQKYGSQAQVPVAERGTRECPYAIARGEIEIDLTATALDISGKAATSFAGPVSFRVVPGDLAGGYKNRFGIAAAGVVTSTIRTLHQYGAVRIWAEDAPPAPIYSDGGVVPGLPEEPTHRTYATGLSPQIFFEEPTLAKVQIPDGFDNRSSPLVGEFLTIGKNPESGEQLLQSCPSDPQRNGEPALMVITGTDPAGFYVTDVSACRQLELTDAGGLDAPRTAEPKEPCQVDTGGGVVVPIEQWDGGSKVGNARCRISNELCTTTAACRSYLPGTYGHMFIYNYSFPEGLDEGDLLWTLNGSVQEFTSTTQMTFPSWTIAEKVRKLPMEEWNKWLQYAPPYEILNRTCGAENVFPPFLTDQLCGHNRRNLKMESLESGLVKLRNVRFPEAFTNCDFNADFSVPFFCDTKPPGENWQWGSCSFPPSPPEPPADTIERVCNSDCVIGTGAWAGKVCSERTTFVGFGQFVAEMNPPGDSTFGFDESVPNRVQRFSLDAGMAVDDGGTADAGLPTARPAQGYSPGTEVNLGCDVDVHVRFGGPTVVATSADPMLTARTPLKHTIGAMESTVSILPFSGSVASCWVAQNFHNRINLITKDALPELQPDCALDDADPEKAKQCSYVRGATFDLVGHLRHLQPGRPRWAVLPRDPDDVCCHPGPGLQCPRPVKPCP